MSIKSAKYSVLWIDDQPEFVETHRALLEGVVSEIHVRHDATSGLATLEHSTPDLILIDLQMPPGDWGGLWFLENFPADLGDVPRIVISGRGSMQECISAIRLGAMDYVEKEMVREELRDVVRKVLNESMRTRPSSDYYRIRQLEISLHSVTIGALVQEATRRGESDIFRSLIPRPIALKTYERLLEHGRGTQEEFLDLLDIVKILDARWNDIEEIHLLETVVRPSNRSERTRWLVEVNEARKVIAHPVRSGGLDDSHRRAIEAAEAVVEGWQSQLHGLDRAR